MGSMIETNPLNHNWSHFVIFSGLTLHQFQKKTAVKGYSILDLEVYAHKSLRLFLYKKITKG